MLRLAIAWLVLSSTALAQVELSYIEKTSIGGLSEIRRFGDLILVSKTSNPIYGSYGIIKAVSPSKFLDVTASKSIFESVELTKIPDAPNEWLLTGPGEFSVEAVAYDPEKGISRAKIRVTLGIGPRPPPTVIRGCMDPKSLNYNPLATVDDGSCKYAPIPDPDPVVLPIAGDGFRVLIIYDDAVLTRMSTAQKNIIFGQDVRQYLEEKCVKLTTSDGVTGEWRMLSKNADMSKAPKIWRDAMLVERASVPWILISNGKQGFSGSLPGTVPEALALLKRFGG